MTSEVIIESRFCGPSGFGNGGYCCGRFASLLEGPSEVTLRAPVPLGTPLTVSRDGDSAEIHTSDGSLMAQASRCEPLSELDPPARPSPGEAREAAESSPFRTAAHPYPGCFVCGPEHPRGLQIQVGSLPGREAAAAATFTPDDSLPSEDRELRPELVWAALDCPSYVPAFWSDDPVLLGRLAAEILAPVPIGSDVVAVSWETGRDGRKLSSASALLDSDGEVLARARALWFRVPAKPEEKAGRPR